MTTLMYDRIDLEESASKSYRLWKGCHITSYALAVIFGLLNFYFLFTTMNIFGDHCVLNPYELVFQDQQGTEPPPGGVATEPTFNETVEILNVTAVNATEDSTTTSSPVLMLDLIESRFHVERYCDLALYTPLLSTIFGMVWGTLFIMCPGGGRSKHGLSEPWRILLPALLFALVFVFFTGYNFFSTNSGLQALCEQFHNVTDTTSCTRHMDAHMPRARSPVPASVAVTLTRAACAGAWACWAAACALLLARCVAGADFSVHRTQVRLHADPAKKLTPVQKQRKQVQIDDSHLRSSASHYRDIPPTDSPASEPTLSSDLNTATYYSPEMDAGRSLNGLDGRRAGPDRELIELS